MNPVAGEARRMRVRGGKVRRGTVTLAGLSGAASGGQTKWGRRRSGCAIGLISPAPGGPCHPSQRYSEFARKLVKSSLGGEAYAYSKMMDRMALLREFYDPVADLSPGVVGMGDCESLSTHLETEQMAPEKYCARHFSAIRQPLGHRGLEGAYWLPGPGGPADELTEVMGQHGSVVASAPRGNCVPAGTPPVSRSDL